MFVIDRGQTIQVGFDPSPSTTPVGSLYVRCGLTTGANDGSSHANAFQSWSAAVNATKSTSQDMYFFSGTTCDVGTSNIQAWSGTENDRAVLGAYYLDNTGTPTIGVSGNKPLLQGTFTAAACSAADSCSLIGAGYTGLVNIQEDDDFTVRDIEIKDWGGRGVDTDGAASATPGNRRIVVDNVTVRHVARAAIVGKETHEWLAFYDNTAINAAMCTRYSYTGCEVRPGSVVFGFNQGRADKGQYAVNIMEGNYVCCGKAEGIGAYGAENVLIRGNIIAATWSSSLYVDGSHNVVVENNIVNGDINETQAPLSREVTALAGGYEAFLGSRRDITQTWRNNLSVSQSGYCFGSSNEDTDTRQTRYYYGNTCAYGKGYSNFTFWPDADIDLVRSRSNVFYSPGNNNCLGHGSNSDFDYNVWDSQPSDADCRGSNDVYDDPDFADDAQMQATGPVNSDGAGGTIVTDFTPAYLNAGSPASGAGDPAGETALCDIDADTLPFDLIRYNVPDKANWEKCLYYDALGNVRDSTAPDAGAVEQGGGLLVKFNPGHYTLGKSTDNPDPPSEICSGDGDTYFKGYNALTGWKFMYDETGAEGAYDWSFIDNALASAASCGSGKRIVFHARHQQFNERARQNECAPQYMFDLGLVAKFKAGSGTDKCIVQVWKKEATDELIKFFQAVGDRYNDHPNFEGVLLIGETALGLDDPEIWDFSNEAYVAQLTRLFREIAPHFPNTLRFVGTNWLSGDVAGMTEIFDTMVEVGGMGTLPPDPRPTFGTNFYKDYGDLIVLGGKGERFGTFHGTNYDGAYQSFIYGEHGNPNFEEWAEDHLHYMFWPASDQQGTDFTDIIQAVKARVDAGDNTEQACPSSFACDW